MCSHRNFHYRWKNTNVVLQNQNKLHQRRANQQLFSKSAQVWLWKHTERAAIIGTLPSAFVQKKTFIYITIHGAEIIGIANNSGSMNWIEAFHIFLFEIITFSNF